MPRLAGAFFFFLEAGRRPDFFALEPADFRLGVFRAERLVLLLERELVLRPAMV